MYQYRQVLVRMRQGDSDRDIARSRLMGRKKLARLRAVAAERGWLAPEVPLPDDAVLATRRVDEPPVASRLPLRYWGRDLNHRGATPQKARRHLVLSEHRCEKPVVRVIERHHALSLPRQGGTEASLMDSCQRFLLTEQPVQNG